MVEMRDLLHYYSRVYSWQKVSASAGIFKFSDVVVYYIEVCFFYSLESSTRNTYAFKAPKTLLEEGSSN